MPDEDWYYLHTNGNLIHKKTEPELESDFVKRVWRLDRSNRAHAWRILLEAAAMGALVQRLKELSTRWEVQPDDFINYIKHTGSSEVNEERKTGLVRMAEEVWKIDLDKLFDKIEEEADANAS
jgi:hypothetical protein